MTEEVISKSRTIDRGLPRCAQSLIIIVQSTDVNSITIQDVTRKLEEQSALLRSEHKDEDEISQTYSDRYTEAESPFEIHVLRDKTDCETYIHNNPDRPVFIVLLSAQSYLIEGLTSKSNREIRFYILAIDRENDASQNSLENERTKVFKDVQDLQATIIHDIGICLFVLGCRAPESSPYGLTILQWAKMCLTRANTLNESETWRKSIEEVSAKINEVQMDVEKYSGDGLANMIAINSSDISDISTEDHSLDASQLNKTSDENERRQSCTIAETEIMTMDCHDGSIGVCPSFTTDRSNLLEISAPINDDQTISSFLAVFYLPTHPTEDTEKACQILKVLLGTNLLIVKEDDDSLTQITESNAFIFILPLSLYNEKTILDHVFSMNPSPMVYVLTSPSNDEMESEEFIQKYADMCVVFDDPTELAVQVTLDIAFEYRAAGDEYAENNNNKDCAIWMYNRCGVLLKALNTMTEKSLIKTS